MSRLSFAALLVGLSAARAAGAACEGDFSAGTGGSWPAWGLNLANTRHVTTDSGAVTARDLPRLELAWAFGVPGARSMMGQPAVAGHRVFIGVDTGAVYSLDVDSGCADWTFKADASVRTAPVVADVGGVWTVFFGDLEAQVYAVDAATGALKWKVRVDAHPAARITGTPQLLRTAAAAAMLFVPVSSSEEGAAGNSAYPCCTFRGSVVALDAESGKRIWKTYMIERDAETTGPNRFGPSGAAVWTTPAIDPNRGLLYAVTGDAYSRPADEATDAVIAVDVDTGAIRWRHQATAGDVWVVSCLGTNTSDDCGPDQDFGAPPMLVRVDGRDLLIAGQKSGNVWAFDPASGAVVWRTPLVANTTEFGGKIVWGGAGDGSNVYFGLGTGGVAAVRLDGGRREWFAALQPARPAASHPGQDSPLTVSADVVFSGGWDGVLRALSTASGEVLWQYDTARAFDTVNGVAAHGGSIGAAGAAVADGKLFVPSGYIGVKNGMPGNVLLVFAPRESR